LRISKIAHPTIRRRARHAKTSRLAARRTAGEQEKPECRAVRKGYAGGHAGHEWRGTAEMIQMQL
jgi:hypothetical protein